MSLDLTWQPSLLDAGPEPTIDETFAGAERINLDRPGDGGCPPDKGGVSRQGTSWIERVPGWVADSDALFAHLLATADWGQRTRKMWDNEVLEPRLTSWWGSESQKPLEPPVLERMRRALSARYGVEFDSMGLNLYRDGRDSVAWHGDRIAREIAEPLVAIVSVGEPRRFLLRPKAKATGLATQRLVLGRGELLVTGGATQRAWEHSVPKVGAAAGGRSRASAGPRMSLTFRHGLLPLSGRAGTL